MKDQVKGVFVGLVLCLVPTLGAAAYIDRLAEAPRQLTAIRQQVAELEQKIGEASAYSQKAPLIRFLIGRLASMADWSMFADEPIEQVRAVVRIEDLYDLLERIGKGSPSYWDDRFAHAAQLADVGYGPTIRDHPGFHRPEPDYTRAIAIYNDVSTCPDQGLAGKAREAVQKISKKMVSLDLFRSSGQGAWDIIVGARNVETVQVLLHKGAPGAAPERQWNLTFSGSSDHRVRRQVLRVVATAVTEPIFLTAMAEGTASEPLALVREDTAYEQQFQIQDVLHPATKKENAAEIQAVTMELWGNDLYPGKSPHGMGQGCGICHIPREAGQ